MVSLIARAQGSQPPVTPGDPRAVYIVVLNREKGAEPEFDKGGAKQLARWSNRVVVELPPAALAAMLKHGRVKYVQHLSNGPVKTAEPGPERASASFVPKALTGGGTLNWSTGDYHYDGSGNIDRVGADSDGKTRRFVYDEVNRLVEAGLEAPMAAPGTYTNYSRYTYDSFGNRLSEQTPTINATAVADRNTNRVTLPGTIVTYDGVGNMTQGGGLIYQYDPFNNLKEVDSWSGVQKMSIYNANDERIIFCGDGSAGPCHWTLRGNGNEVLREYESGPIGNGNSFWSYYLWVEDSLYRGTFLAGAQREAAEGDRLDFHLDHLGSPRLTTNAAGQQVTASEFAPFGRELTSIMQESQLGYDRTETHRFTGHERDFVEGTGSESVNFIDYMHARTYTPVFGRFLSVDPSEGNLGDPQSWNRYAYALNNPVTKTDPDGRCTVDKEQHNWLWCLGHDLGLTKTQHETAQGIRKEIASQHLKITTADGRPVDFNKLPDAQVVAAYQALLDQEHDHRFAKSASVPPAALEVLKFIDAKGAAPQGYKGGRAFENDGRGNTEVLPKTDAAGRPIKYREWDVNPKVNGVDRGGERLVTGSDGSAYYTDTHYTTFVKIR